jgi:hypothetical protein
MAKNITDKTPWTTIGWQKITLQVPADWNLAGIGGDARNGYLRIDGPDRPRVEVKWETPAKAVNVSTTIDTYLKDLQKKARKQRLGLTVEPDVKLLSKRHKRKSSLQCFAWRGDVQAYGVIWYCPQCSRVTMAQVSGGLDENLKPLALDILRSLEDHSREGWDVWSVYGLLCHVPSDFELQGQQLVTGLTQFHFARRQSLINVSRYGLADVVLKEALTLAAPGGEGRGGKGKEGAIGQSGNWATGQSGNQPQPPEPDFLISQLPSATLGTSEEEASAAERHPGGPLGPLIESVGGRVMDFVDRFKAPAAEPEPEPEPTLAGYLGHWCAYQRRKEWRLFRVAQEETEWRGHAAVLLRGTRNRLVDRVRNFLYQFVRLPYPFVLEAYAWYCPDTNQIFLVEHVRGEREEALLEQLREGIPCHE